MKEQTIPLYIAFAVIIAVLVGYYFALLGLIYVSAHSLAAKATAFYELEISSLLDMVYAVFLLSGGLFLSLILMLLFLSIPFMTKLILTYPFRSQHTHR